MVDNDLLLDRFERWATTSICKKFIFTKQELRVLYAEFVRLKKIEMRKYDYKYKKQLKELKEEIEHSKWELNNIQNEIEKNRDISNTIVNLLDKYTF